MQTLYHTQQAKFYWFSTDDLGFLVDLDPLIHTLEARIYSIDPTAGTMTQEWPLPIGTWHLVDLVVDKVSVGKYKVDFDTLGTYTAGRYLWEWRLQTVGSDELIVMKDFEIITNRVPSVDTEKLCLIQDLREEGLDATVTDMRIIKSILRGDEYVERYCAREFGWREVTMRVKCQINGQLHLPEPLCCLESVKEEYFDATTPQPLNNSDLIPFTRHLRGIDGAPSYGSDDRDNPKITGSFARGVFYQVKGVFGYTEWDGSGTGMIPRQVRIASINLGLKYQQSLMGSGGGGGVIPSFAERIIEEKTATQSYKLSPLSDGSEAWNMVAGDTELVRLLRPYRRPPRMALV